MHIADIESGNLGATGVVAAGIPTAVGIGLALQMKRSNRVLLSFFGDGASNEGEFHESLNMASIWKLPIVFIVDNNQYGMSMASEKSMNIDHISQRACAYNIPGESVDGNDVIAVYHAVSEAVQRARKGEGISLVENITYRWRGHSKSDRNLYRSDEEIKEWQKLDPITRFADFLTEEKIMTKEEVEQIKHKAFNAIKEATEAALALPEPSPNNMEEEVYAP
jgi:pyruvate dehydrogenase E1 component alpha subunit